jgi:hypothetical protein
MPDLRWPRGAFARLAITLLLGLAVVSCALAPRLAHAAGRAGPPVPSLYAPTWQAGAPAIAASQAWRTGSAVARSSVDLVVEAARYVGAGKFTGLPGAWCADAVSVWLERTGRPPLANRLAASAMSYGAPDAEPHAGDLAVTAQHVGVVAHVYNDGSIDEISGNWGRRVAEAHVAQTRAMRFVTP